MVSTRWDVAVVGVGTMGSMAMMSLARRGLRVIGFERFGLGHELGAAGGESRIFRTAYREGSSYVPLLRDAYHHWRQLEEASGSDLLLLTDALTIGREGDVQLQEVLHSAEEWDVSIEVLDAAEAGRRYPQHTLTPDELVVVDHEGGMLRPLEAIRAACAVATAAGATIRTNTQVERIQEAGTGVEIVTGDGERHLADRVIVAAGPWTRALLPSVAEKFRLQRVLLNWFPTEDPAMFRPERFPVGLRVPGARPGLSFFPTLDGTRLKMNYHTSKLAVADPESFDQEPSQDESMDVVDAMLRSFTGVRPERSKVAGYMEGYTLDNHGIIDFPQGMQRVVALAAFSGHGFKLAPVFGEAAAELVLNGEPAPYARLFSAARATL